MPDGQASILDSLNASLVVEYGITISPEIVSQIPFDSPLLDYFDGLLARPIVKPDKAAVFGVLTATSFTASRRGSFPVGGDPSALDVERALRAIPKKSYGAAAGVKDVDVIASSMPGAPGFLNREAYRDDAEFLLNLLFVRTRQAIDYGMVAGDAASYPTDFNGLETSVTLANGSQILDAAGSGSVKAYIDDLITQMMIRGLTPTAIAGNPIFMEAVVQAYTSGITINVETGKEVFTAGVHANAVVTPAGTLPLIKDRRFTVTGSAPTFTGDVFILVAAHEGVPILYPEWQVLPTALNLARVPGFYTSQTFAVWSHLTLVERSDWFAQGRVNNLTATYRAVSPTIVPGD